MEFTLVPLNRPEDLNQQVKNPKASTLASLVSYKMRKKKYCYVDVLNHQYNQSVATFG